MGRNLTSEHFFVMSSRTLLESGIFSPVEGVGIAITTRNDGRNHCLSRSLCSIQKQGGGSESNFRVKGPVGIMHAIGRGLRIKNGMSQCFRERPWTLQKSCMVYEIQ